ncbi:glycosyltransferase family 4 protein [bacterium]|nr:glycosyltransferase family 4 protein [bacterium]
MSKQLLLISNKFPYPPNDGGAIATMSMIQAFYHLGYEVTVLAMNTYKRYVFLDDLPKEVEKLARFYAVDVDIRIKPFAVLKNLFFSKEPYHITRFTSTAFRNHLENILKEQKYDLVQLEGLYLTPYVDQIRKQAPGTPITLRAHNIEHEIWVRKSEEVTGKLRKYYYGVTATRLKEYETRHLGGNTYDAIVAITDRDAKKIKDMGTNIPITISNVGINLSNLMDDKEIKMEHPSLFYIGALDWTPNQEGVKWLLSEVWPEISRMYPEVKLYIAGLRMPPNFMNSQVKNVVVLGEVKNAYTYMRSKSIMVVPLFSGSGMRVKIVEGMALQKAIVATNIAVEGIPALHGDQILIADTADQFINCIATLIESKSMVETLGRHAQEFILERFDLNQVTQSLLSFYENSIWKKEE